MGPTPIFCALLQNFTPVKSFSKNGHMARTVRRRMQTSSWNRPLVSIVSLFICNFTYYSLSLSFYLSLSLSLFSSLLGHPCHIMDVQSILIPKLKSFNVKLFIFIVIKTLEKIGWQLNGYSAHVYVWISVICSKKFKAPP